MLAFKLRCVDRAILCEGEMERMFYRLATAILISAMMFCARQGFAVTVQYVVTNDDVPYSPNTATFYKVTGTPSAPQLKKFKVVQTHGQGIGDYFAAATANVLRDSQQQCVYAADGATSDIAAIVLQTQKLVGRFKGSSLDDGGLVGLSLAMNHKYLYASFSGSYTLATFKVEPGCKLRFVKDADAIGKELGTIDGMAVHGKILIVAYADGSIESFDISKGAAVPNGDEQLSTGTKTGNLPAGVDITSDGHFAIFGDISGSTTVEVSDISSGKLTPTVVYTVSSASDANNVRLSPDEKLLYIGNNNQGTVTAAFFDKATGKVSTGCTSLVLKGFGTNWTYTAALATASNTGEGGTVFVAESGQNSGIGKVKIKLRNSGCTLTEEAGSPVADHNSPDLRSIATYPPRAF
jgi:WD40 repeat protein